jgi:hypothetical protein
MMQQGGKTMRTILTAILALTIAGSAQAQIRGGGTCKANQSGDILLTSVEYDNGYKVEAPWKVVATQGAEPGPVRTVAVVDHIIETNPATRKRQLTPLPGAIEMTFQGETNALMLREAADLWCSTVAKALGARQAEAAGRAEVKRVVM